MIQGARVRNGAEMWGGCLCAGEELNQQTRLVSSCAAPVCRMCKDLSPRMPLPFPPDTESIDGWLGPDPSFSGGKAGCLSPELCLSRNSVLEQGSMPNFSQTTFLASHGSRAALGTLLGVPGAGRACSHRDIFL